MEKLSKLEREMANLDMLILDKFKRIVLDISLLKLDCMFSYRGGGTDVGTHLIPLRITSFLMTIVGCVQIC